MSSGIDVSGLTFGYPQADANVLTELDLTVEAGERVALLGPNGSGKTTFVLHLNGLRSATSGAIRIGELELTPENLPEIRRRVGMVFQDPNDQLFMHSVADDVAFGPSNLGLDEHEREHRVAEALDAVHAGELADRTPHHLSGGEKRRAAIATVLAMRPDILVLDEPTSGLDPVGRQELANLLTSLPQTQLVVTHDLPFALATCPRSVVLDGGRVAVDLPTAELLSNASLLAKHRLALPFGYGTAIV